MLRYIEEVEQLLPEERKKADPEKSAEEEEKAALAKLSNIQWLVYPFKKTVLTFIDYFRGRRSKDKDV